MKTVIKGKKKYNTKSISEVLSSLDVDLFSDRNMIVDTSGNYIIDYDVQEDDSTIYKYFRGQDNMSAELVKIHPSELPEDVEWSISHEGEVNIFDEGIKNKVFTIVTINSTDERKTSAYNIYNLLEEFYAGIYDGILQNNDGVTYMVVADTETGDVEVLSTDQKDIIDTFTQANIKKQLS